MSYSPTDPNLDPLRDWFPDRFPTGSQKAPRADVRRVVPRFPLPTGGTTRRTLRPLSPTTGSQTRSCRICGCTEFTPCSNPLDQPCWWIEPDLCSACRAHAEACS